MPSNASAAKAMRIEQYQTAISQARRALITANKRLDAAGFLLQLLRPLPKI